MSENKLPPRILEKLKNKGYFNLTKEERLKANKKCFDSLLRSSRGDPKAEIDALRDWRGGYR